MENKRVGLATQRERLEPIRGPNAEEMHLCCLGTSAHTHTLTHSMCEWCACARVCVCVCLDPV